ncbi:MAG: pyrimidine dimer DNA glycosylase/endonuclease V [Arsenophonus endosymbiont of Dermacentor nuttalli]
MTRINVIPPNELCDQHLLAEHRELTRIPNYIVKKKGNVTLSTLSSYTLGKGHDIFLETNYYFCICDIHHYIKSVLIEGFLLPINGLLKYKTIFIYGEIMK